ncbi:MFS transporter [Natronoglycomyces albus]|uniref:MFS transporter n=1 Tax=Natronoglycomyces albus TaxID=2811108 RepID=A0A895XQF2_9ACTN|nr:MFS transporter [Natronoglycomyces albus]QSB04500.1 MFS transporter [Natronoglycomyces albus]
MSTVTDSVSAANPHTRALASPRQWWGLSILVLPTWLLGLDVGVLHLAAPQLGAALAPSSTQMLWILDIYGFMIAGFLVTMGTLGDRIGRRKLLLIGAAAFGCASVLAAYSQSAEMLILTRALLGIAGATLMPSTLALISNIFVDPRQRSIAIGIWLVNFMSGIALGPVVGGLLLEYFWWGSVFLLGVPVMVLLLATGPFILPEFKDPSAGRLDLVSVALSLAALLPIVYGFKEMAKSGLQPAALLAIGIGLLMGLVFARRQRRLPNPLLDLSLFRNSTFSAALVVLLLVHIALSFIMVLLQQLQLVEGLSALHAGLWLLPGLVGNIAMAIIAPILARHVQPVYVIVTGLVLAVAGYGFYTQVDTDGGLATLIVGSVLMFVGLAPMIVLGTDLVVSAAPPAKAGSAASLSETAAELGIALGVAYFGSVMTAVYARQMAQADLPHNPDGGEVDPSVRDNLPAALAAAEQGPPEFAHQLLNPAREAFTAGLNLGAVTVGLMLVAVTVAAMLSLRGIKRIG